MAGNRTGDITFMKLTCILPFMVTFETSIMTTFKLRVLDNLYAYWTFDNGDIRISGIRVDKGILKVLVLGRNSGIDFTKLIDFQT